MINIIDNVPTVFICLTHLRTSSEILKVVLNIVIIMTVLEVTHPLLVYDLKGDTITIL